MEKHGNKSSIETYPKNCTECNKHTTCKSWYGGCGCSEAPVTVFGSQGNRKTLMIDEK